MFLAAAAFSLILGTFRCARSVLTSVHALPADAGDLYPWRSWRRPSAAQFALFWRRRTSRADAVILASQPRAALAINLLLTSAALAVLVSALYPAGDQRWRATAISVGAPVSTRSSGRCSPLLIIVPFRAATRLEARQKSIRQRSSCGWRPVLPLSRRDRRRSPSAARAVARRRSAGAGRLADLRRAQRHRANSATAAVAGLDRLARLAGLPGRQPGVALAHAGSA